MQENNQLLKKKVISGLAWKFGERIIAQLTSFIVSVILARLLLPSDYGAVALVMVFISIANVFVSAGFGNALVQKKDVDNLDFSSVFYINIAVSLILYIALFLAAPFIAGFYNMPVLSQVIRVLGIVVIIAAIKSVQQAYVSREMIFQRFFWSTLFGTLISGIVGVYMAYKGFGVWALVAQYLTNSFIDTAILWFTIRWRPVLKCSWKRARGLVSFGWKILLSALLETGYNELRSLLIGKIYSAGDLAFYNQGDKYPKLIVANINDSISSVLFPAISKVQENTEKVKTLTRRAIQVSSYVMWPMMVGLGVIAEPLVRIVLTEKWLPCVPYIRIFCFVYGLWPIHDSNLQALKAMGRSDLYLGLEIIKKIAGIIALLASVKYGPLAIAWSLVITSIASAFINSAPNRRLLNYSYKEQFMDLMPPFFLSVVMAVVIYPVSLTRLPDLLLIIIQIISGIIVYLVSSVITRQKSFKYLSDIIKHRDISR